jgi:hypothetical protein
MIFEETAGMDRSRAPRGYILKKKTALLLKDKQFPEVPVLNIVMRGFLFKEFVKKYLLCLIAKINR